MQTECSADLFGFAPVEGRQVVAGFDGGRMTSEAGAMLLGATSGQLRLVERFAGCFTDHRAAELVEHTVPSLVGQRVFGIALGYEDLIDHDQLRHDTMHRHHEERFFHSYYDNSCYLPLYVFCGRHLLAAKLRPANIDGSAGSVAEVARIVAGIRQRWPNVRILLRADSGFAREALMAWCENNGVDFLF